MDALPERLPEGGAQPLDDPLDAGDVVVLADDEGAERLPRLLPEHADAGGVGDGAREDGVGGEAALDLPVVAVEVEIAAPHRLEVLRAAQDADFPGRLCNVTGPAARHTKKAAVGQPFPAERLSAVERFGQGEIARIGENHVVSAQERAASGRNWCHGRDSFFRIFTLPV